MAKIIKVVNESVHVHTSANVSIEQVERAIDKSIEIVDGSKQAVKDFVRDKFNEILDNCVFC
jgi:uncharacterized protein YlzI (FlbEa/FlbD family)